METRIIIDLTRLNANEREIEREKVQMKPHTPPTYTRNNMGKKCEGNCGLWVLNELISKIYHDNLKKIVKAVWELPAK